MAKIDYEILEHWWEYFVVIWWAIFRPTNKQVLARSAPTKIDIQNKYEDALKGLLSRKDENKISGLTENLATRNKAEEERKTTIESKAHSLIGQTGIAVTLLISTLSLGTGQFKDWHFGVKLITWFLFFSVILNLVVAALHARNVVALKEGYAHEDFESFLGDDTNQLSPFLEMIYIIEHNSYINDVKATYLKFSHWYYKCSFIILVITAIIVPLLIMVTTRWCHPKPFLFLCGVTGQMYDLSK